VYAVLFLLASIVAWIMLNPGVAGRLDKVSGRQMKNAGGIRGSLEVS
jgi:hypothetical protein